MVGGFVGFKLYYGGINLKRTQALLESNLPAIRLRLIRKKGVSTFVVQPFLFFGKLHGFKNSFLVAEVHVPLDKVYAVLCTQSPVQVQVVFQVSEVALDAIGGSRYFMVVQIVKHVRQGSFYRQIGAPEQLVSVPVPLGLFMMVLFIQVSFVPLMPGSQLPRPPQPVIGCLNLQKP